MGIVGYKVGSNPVDLWPDNVGGVWVVCSGRLLRVGPGSPVDVGIPNDGAGIVSIPQGFTISFLGGFYRFVDFQGVEISTVPFGGFAGKGIRDSSGYMWIVCPNSNVIKRCNASGIVGTWLVGHNPTAIAIDEDTVRLRLWVSNTGSRSVTRWTFFKDLNDNIDLTTGVTSNYNTAPEPRGLVVTPEVTWVACGYGVNSDCVVKLTDTSEIQFQVGGRPWDIAQDKNGNLWVVNYLDASLVQIDNKGVVLQTIGVGKKPCRVVIDSNNTIWVACFEDDTVLAFSDLII